MRRLLRLPLSPLCSSATARTALTPLSATSLPRTRLSLCRHPSSTNASHRYLSTLGAVGEEGRQGSDSSAPSVDEDWDEEDDAIVESQLEQRDLKARPLNERVEELFGEEGDTPAYVAPSFDERLSALPQLYTATAITAHSEADALKYFPISPDQQSRIPPSLTNSLSQEFSLAGPYLQLSPSYLPFLTRLSLLPTPRGRYFLRKPFAIHGPHGSGKSALLYYLHLWANESGWLVVSVQADEFSREKMGWHVENKEREGIFDQPLYTQYFFGGLKERQGELLKKVQLKGKYEYEGVHTLYDLVDLASRDQALAPKILYEFIDELRKVSEVPVLVLIDNLNVWDVDSDYVDPHYGSRPLPARRLALVDAFSTFQHIAPNNGASVWCTTSHATLKGLGDHMNMRKVRPVLLDGYSHEQLKHVLVHYHVSGLLLSEVDRNLVAKVKNLSGGIPKLVQTVAYAL